MRTIKKERTAKKTLKHTIEYLQRNVDGTFELRTQTLYACNSQEMREKKRNFKESIKFNEVGFKKRNIKTGRVTIGKVAYK